MKALLRPAFVLGLSIAIAATSFIGSSSVALSASTVVTWSVDGSVQKADLFWDVYQGAPVSLTGTLTSAAGLGPYAVDVDWGDGTSDSFLKAGCAVVPCAALQLQKATPYMSQPPLPIVIFLDAPGAANRSVVRVNVLPNLAPSIASFEVTAGPEGGSSTLALTFTDPEVTDTHRVSVAWGDGAITNSEVIPASESSFNAAHVFADKTTYTVGVTLTDIAGNSVTDSKSVTPTNVGPTVGPLTLSSSPALEDQNLTVTGAFTDPSAHDTFTLSVTWGDGTSSPNVSLGEARDFLATHAYTAAGTATITVTVTDSDGASDSSSAELVIEPGNHAPSGLSFVATPNGSNVVVTGSFTDPDATDTHTVALNWGDGGPTQQVDADGRTFTAPHVYAASNTYTVTASLTDHPAGATTGPLSHEVVVTIAPPPATSASDLLDEMASVVRSFDLDRNTERWLLRKLDDIKSSLAYGNGQVCGTGLNHVLSFSDRTLTDDQHAALSAYAPQLQAAAGCTSIGALQSPKVQKAPAVTTTAAPAPKVQATEPKKDTTTKDAAKEAAKSTKADSKATPGRSAH